MKPVLGILGGMGALASAEFTRTVYEENQGLVEQESPVVILLSDPTFPDRTQAILNGAAHEIVEPLTRSLTMLYECHATRVVMACITLHFALPMLSERLRRRVISLIDVTLESVRASGQKQLFLCTTGARAAGLFEHHPLWPEIRSQIVYPEEHDQELTHALLYQYKSSGNQQPFLPHLDRMLRKYKVDSFVAGCTELHLLTRHLRKQDPTIQFIDPLLEIARNLDAYLWAENSMTPMERNFSYPRLHSMEGRIEHAAPV